MNNGGRCGDTQVLRHVCECGFGVFDLNGRFMGKWGSERGDRGWQCYFSTSFMI